MPLDEQINTAMSQNLAGLLNGSFGATLQQAFRPLLEEAFRRGVRAGAEMSKRAIDAALFGDDQPRREVAREAQLVAPAATTNSSTRRRRASPGAVRQIVELVLQDVPGARVIDIQNTAKTLDASISQSSVSNELNRHRGTRYRQEGRGWFLIGDPELAMPLADSLSYGAEPAVEESDRAAA